MSVDIKEIDDQHKKFIEIMSEMQTAVDAKLSPAAVGAILVKMYGYAHYHFGTEENYFAQFLYEEAEEHKSIHDKFFLKVSDFRRRHAEGEDVALETMNFMFNWLVSHIENVDRRYIDCFHQHGLR